MAMPRRQYTRFALKETEAMSELRKLKKLVLSLSYNEIRQLLHRKAVRRQQLQRKYLPGMNRILWELENAESDSHGN